MKILKRVLLKNSEIGWIQEENGHLFFSSNVFEENRNEISFIDILEELPAFFGQNIFACAENYKGVGTPSEIKNFPIFFTKALQSIANEKATVPIQTLYNTGSKIWGECELALVLKDDATILGVTLANDVTLTQDAFKKHDHHLPFFKSHKNFCPCSSLLLPKSILNNYVIRGYHNNELLREGTAQDQLFSAEELLAWLSSWHTITTGDLMLLGAPARVCERKYLKPGDSFKIVLNDTFELMTHFS